MTHDRATLRRGALSTLDAVAMAIAVLSPAGAMAYNTSAAALFGGTATPFAFLIGGLGCLCLAHVVVGFSRQLASAGYAYTYCSRALGPNAGFMAGWLYSFGFFCFVPMTMAGVGGFARDRLREDFGQLVPPSAWAFIFVGGMCLLFILLASNIKVTARLQLVVGGTTVLIVLALVSLLTYRAGSMHTLTPFVPSNTLRGGADGILYATIFGILSYIGFETAAVLAEETKEPLTVIPRSVTIAVLFAITFYVWTSYTIAVSVGADSAGAQRWARDPRILASLAREHVGQLFARTVDWAAIVSGMIVSIACATATCRTLFAMGREGAGPFWFGRVHPRLKSPINAALTVTAGSVMIATIVGVTEDAISAPYTIYYYLASVGAVSIISVYIMLCTAAIVAEIKYRRSLRARSIMIAGAGATLFLLAIYGSIYPGELPPWPLWTAPYLVAGWLGIGGLVLLWLRRYRPDCVARLGSILGESAE